MPFNRLPLEVADGSGRIWSFAGREFDESRLELRVGGSQVELELKPLEVLIELLKIPGEVASKERLLNAVWPGLSVVEGSLTTAIHKLRRALSDDDSTIVVTVPRVGYRLAASVQSKVVSRPNIPELNLAAGDSVPGRASWTLLRSLSGVSETEVWLAEHSKSLEFRVYKFATDAIHLRALKREVTVSRFLRESLGERSDLVRIFDWNFDKPPYFLESEYGGPNLKEWSEAQGGLASIPMQRRLGVLAKIAHTIALAHDAGVVHADIKPTNILLPDSSEQIKIADFGSASLADPSRLDALNITRLGLTEANLNPALSGTLMYLAPEVICGNSPTAAADIYALGIMLYQLVTGDFRRPLSADWERTINEPLIKEDIALAACGDPAMRLRSAEELAERISNLEVRRIEQIRFEQERQRALISERRRVEARLRRPWVVLAVIAVLISVASLWWLTRPAPKSVATAAYTPPLNTVAVLPLQNTGSDHTLDFLSQAVPDEITTLLSQARSISVRSFDASSKYTQPAADAQTVGNELKVGSIIRGHFINEGATLAFAFEAIEVNTGRVFWRDTLTTPATSLIEMRKKLAAKMKAPLAAALGSSAFTVDSCTRPQNEEAYNLYLRAAAIPMDSTTNRQAITMLEKSVKLDSRFAPSWLLLGRRYYAEGRYANGGQIMMEHSEASYAQALALEPTYIAAGIHVAINRLEHGDLFGGFHEAEDLVRRRPDSADAHHAVGAAYRYAGLLDDSADECDTAFRIDPHTRVFGLRSCAILFALRGNDRRAMDFLNLDPTSDFHNAILLTTLLRKGDVNNALRVAPAHIPQWKSYDLLAAYIRHSPESEIARFTVSQQTSEDPEANYLSAANLAYCGQTTDALRLLRLAIKGNYCSYPDVDLDPFFDGMRKIPEFIELRRAGLACQQKFEIAWTRFPPDGPFAPDR